MATSIGETLLDSVNRMFDFSGRSSRRQFWPFIVFFAATCILVPMTGSALPDSGLMSDPVTIDMRAVLSDYMFRQGLLFAVFVLPLMSITTRRLHDVGWSGLWAVPLLILHLVVFLLQAKVLADSVQSTNPSQSQFFGILTTVTMIYNAATLCIAILCLLPSNPYANSYGDPQHS